MTKFPTMIFTHKQLPAYGLFLTLGALITFTVLMASPSDPKNAILLGYSLERIIIGAGVLISSLALLLWTFNLFRHPERSQRLWAILTKRGTIGDTFFFLALAILLLGWVLMFLPPYRLGGLAGYVAKLSPIIGWLAITGAVTSVLILIERRRQTTRSFQNDKVIWKIASIFLGAFILLSLIILATGLGIHYPADYWYGAGVPILGLQVLFSILAGGVVLLSEQYLTRFNSKKFDLFIFFAIWIVSAWFWSRLPISPNYFMPDTANNIIYPYSDGATFDTGAQYALIGQGMFNGQYFDRAVYTAFLAYLHIFFGQNFETLMTAQAAVFAVFPAVVYLIGRELQGRALGISAGVLIALRGMNAIVAAKWIDTASPKMVLTDFPTAIGISIFLLLFLKWFKLPSKSNLLVWAGAVFGLTLMVRIHILTLFPVVLAFIPFVIKLRWKQIVLAGMLVVIGVLSVSLPWELRNQARGIPMYYMYYYRFDILLRYRYGIGVESHVPSLVTVKDHAHFDSAASSNRNLSRHRDVQSGVETFCESTVCSIANHFVHNAVTSVLTLPSSHLFHDIWNTVKSDLPYWRQDWRGGSIGNDAVVMIFINLVVVSLGVGALWKKNGTLTLLPVLIFLAYILTNSLGFTSGGRYIAPVDWILYLFFAAGGLQCINWLLKMAGFETDDQANKIKNTEFPQLQKGAYFRALPTFVMILALGMVLPLSEIFFQPRYQVREPEKILAELEGSGLLEQAGLSNAELLEFLSHPGARIREGRALYPRYYPSGTGETDRSTYYRYLDYQRLVFTLIGPYSPSAEGVVIPGFAPPFPFHAEDVVVLGCWNTTYYAPFIDAVVVFVTSGDGYVYTRSPGSPLQCPLQTP
ncbi:MAG: hypothetical protein OHK003_19650 [Anaerolineales bacterium]